MRECANFRTRFLNGQLEQGVGGPIELIIVYSARLVGTKAIGDWMVGVRLNF